MQKRAIDFILLLLILSVLAFSAYGWLQVLNPPERGRVNQIFLPATANAAAGALITDACLFSNIPVVIQYQTVAEDRAAYLNIIYMRSDGMIISIFSNLEGGYSTRQELVQSVCAGAS